MYKENQNEKYFYKVLHLYKYVVHVSEKRKAMSAPFKNNDHHLLPSSVPLWWKSRYRSFMLDFGLIWKVSPNSLLITGCNRATPRSQKGWSLRTSGRACNLLEAKVSGLERILKAIESNHLGACWRSRQDQAVLWTCSSTRSPVLLYNMQTSA